MKALEDLEAKTRGLGVRPRVPGETSDHDGENGDATDPKDQKGRGRGRGRGRGDKKDKSA